jgi:beta-lactamase class D
VWAFQDVARRVGPDEMGRRLRAFDYGNADTGGGIDTFWLTGGLRISALEQVRFLQRLHERQLPVSERAASLVEGIMREGRSGAATLHAKTGWAGLDALDPEQTDIGWYVGFVSREGAAVYFALNLDLERPGQAGLRRSIALRALADLGVY